MRWVIKHFIFIQKGERVHIKIQANYFSFVFLHTFYFLEGVNFFEREIF